MPNISDEQIISALRERFSLRVRAIEFIPLGWDAASWSYRVEAEEGVYYLKVRKGIPNPAGILIDEMELFKIKTRPHRPRLDSNFFIPHPPKSPRPS